MIRICSDGNIDESTKCVKLRRPCWRLYQAGYLEEAEATLAKSVDLAPHEYELARKNLEKVRDALAGERTRGESEM